MVIQNNQDSIERVIEELQSGNISQAETICSRILNQNSDDPGALYLYGIILQKQGNVNIAIDYINKSIGIDALRVSNLQKKLNEIDNKSQKNNQNNQMHDQQNLAKGFEATRELLKKFEQNDSINNQEMNVSSNNRLDSILNSLKSEDTNQQKSQKSESQAPLKNNLDSVLDSLRIDSNNETQSESQMNETQENSDNRLDSILNKLRAENEKENNIVENNFQEGDVSSTNRLDSVLNSLRSDSNFQQQNNIQTQDSSCTEENIRALLIELQENQIFSTVLFWPGINVFSLGDIASLQGLKFSMKHDELRPPTFYSQFILDSKLPSMDILLEKALHKTTYDVVLITFDELQSLGLDNFLSLTSFKNIGIADGFINSNEKDDWNNAFISRGLVQHNNLEGVYSWKDKCLWGEILVAEGRVNDAVKCFENILEVEPNNLNALNNLGVISFALGNAQTSETFFLKAIEIDPQYMNALINIADIYISAQKYDEAAKYIQKALDVDENEPSVWDTLGSFYNKLGKKEDADKAIQKGNELRASK